MTVTRKPLAIDLYCGLGGWAEAFLAEGWNCLGFDIERHDYGSGGYPGQLVLQDVLTLNGAQFRDADLIVASPPCQFFSRMAMPFKCPWKREEFERRRNLALSLFWACWRIQHEASEAAGRLIPMIVENVKGTERWVGSAAWHYGSFYLWGDIPALMPQVRRLFKGAWNNEVPGKMRRIDIRDGADHTRHLTNPREHEGTKNGGGSWFAIGSPGQKNVCQNPDGRKVPGIKLSETGFNVAAAQRLREEEGTKQRGSGAACFDKALDERRKQAAAINNRKDRPDYPYSPGDSRKAASAQIAKIPYPLAQHIARVFKP